MENQKKNDELNKELKLSPVMNGASLTKASLLRLREGKWLNDDIIDAYCLYLSKIKFPGKENVLIFSTFLWPSLLRAFPSDEKAEVERIQRAKSINIYEKDLVLIPALVSGNHWVLILLTNPNHFLFAAQDFLNSFPADVYEHGDYVKFIGYSKPKLIIVDSYPPSSYDALKMFDTLRRFLDAEFFRLYSIGNEIQESLLPGEVQQRSPQKNTSDCGIHVLHNIELIMEKIPSSYIFTEDIIPNFTAESVKGKRRNIHDILWDLVSQVD